MDDSQDEAERDPGFKRRLAKIIGQQEPYPWAASLGIGKSTFAGPWRNGAIPQTRTLLKIAQNTNISLNWLLTGRGPERLWEEGEGREETEQKPYVAYLGASDPAEAREGRAGGGVRAARGAPVEEVGERYRVPREEYCLVPRYGMTVGSGQRLHSEQVVDYLSFKISWVEQTMGLDANELALVHVVGDSMEPTLKEGDLLLLDRRGFSPLGPVRSARNDALYVLLRNGELIVKRLQFGFDGSVTVQSDNPVYAAQTLAAEHAQTLQVMGRVVWIGRRM
ncbi:MAG: helix-turn-helix domain-containing protein [Magnetococcus sp. MYC-9]